MATNFRQDGKTIEIENTTGELINSGAPVVIGDMLAIAITDIPAGEIGDGFTEGVFYLPKSGATVIERGARVYFDTEIQAEEDADSINAGIAWEPAGAGDTLVLVKINA